MFNFFLDIYDKDNSPIMEIIDELKKKGIICKYFFKITPNYKSTKIKEKYPYIKIISRNKIPNNIDFVISGSNTTASYYAYYNNLPLMIFLRSGYINMIPYFGKYNFYTFYDVNSFKKKN